MLDRIKYAIHTKLYNNTLYKRAFPRLWIIREYFRKDKPVISDKYIGNNIYLYYFRISDSVDNLGDYLSEVVVSHFKPKNDREIDDKRPCYTLYSIGSILGFRTQDAIVWGSGLLSPDPLPLLSIRFSRLDIRAVRGPKTREQLLLLGKKCPEVFGDPAILMPKIFSPQTKRKKFIASVILNHGHQDYLIPENNVHLIDTLTTDYKSFITQIVQSERIISSSLHGIILAESYGVPAVLLLHENQSTFKYEDWYYSTGRYDIVIAHSVEEALTLRPMDLPELSDLQEQLVKSFPKELWE